ncbi:hypothetical protein SDC9_176558 [bioreactor metagenome]|uniref:Uncharacterized protein n=1 Tax=bioreactor metagenome TaxID=1076179 RepID=A0A645GQE2_9ZZZZ
MLLEGIDDSLYNKSEVGQLNPSFGKFPLILLPNPYQIGYLHFFEQRHVGSVVLGLDHVPGNSLADLGKGLISYLIVLLFRNPEGGWLSDGLMVFNICFCDPPRRPCATDFIYIDA